MFCKTEAVSEFLRREWIFFNELNYTDSIYFSDKDSYEYAKTKGLDLISVEKWIFVLNLNDLTKKY